jgi:predicted regulator of Ras-like GTPase activity (Roadblock/LC7/MglB family)
MNLGNFLNQIISTFQRIFAASGNASEISPASETAELTTVSDLGNLSEVSPTQEAVLPNISDSDLSEVYPTTIEEKIMINTSMLQEILQSFVSGTPDVQGAALVTPDGLALTSVLPGDMDDERTAAMSASMLSLGERIGRELSRGNVERIVVEGEKGYGILVGCGADAVLLVLASSAAKQGLLFLEIKRAVSRIAPLIA